jgi:manganese oxidase
MLHCHLPHHMMNQMVSMVGPMAHAGHGMTTGGGMEAGMGMVRQGNALSEDLGPKFGRGMGMAAEERQVSNAVRPETAMEQGGGHAGHGAHQGSGGQGPKKRVPGYPQDMFMPMDDAVAKPETYGMAKNWTGATQGMMTIVRVLPPDKYDEIVRRVEAAREAPPKPKAAPATPQGHRH